MGVELGFSQEGKAHSLRVLENIWTKKGGNGATLEKTA
jgi:hypothetical protein